MENLTKGKYNQGLFLQNRSTFFNLQEKDREDPPPFFPLVARLGWIEEP